MERSRGLCVSGRSTSICKDPKVGTNFGVFEECFFSSSSHSSETSVLPTAPMCLFSRLHKISVSLNIY